MIGDVADEESMRVRDRAPLSLAVLAAGLIAGCALDDGRELSLSLELPLSGTRVADGFPIGGKRIPLPPGEWIVIGTGIEKDGERGFHTLNMLALIEKNQLLAATEISTNIPIPKAGDGGKPKDGRGEGWLTHQGCVRDDMHFLNVTANIRLGEQDCWWVNHWRMHRTGLGAAEHWKKAQKYLAENKIKAPLDMIGVTYRLANQDHYVTVTYFLSQRPSDFDDQNDVHWSIASWETSVWHPDQVKKDPKRRQHIDKVIAWGKSWYPQIRQIFRADSK